MSTTDPATSLRLEIDIDVPREHAFAVFTEQFDRIKPREYNMLEVDIEQTVFETHVGGHVYDRGVDGSVCQWARVLAFEPPHRVVFSWASAPNGSLSPTWRRPARSKCASSPNPRSAPGSSSSTATSTATGEG
jgi:uncharacterized protein YndB with AHSA1/START domain